MMDPVSERSSSGVLVGVGAGLAIVVLLVVQSVTSVGSFTTKTETLTSTSTAITTSTVTTASPTTTTVTATQTSTSLAKGAFVIFHQFGCGGYMNEPWAVTVGNETKTQPPGSLAELRSFYGSVEIQGYDANASSIVFFLANGVYNYTAFPFSGSGGTMKTPSGTNIMLNESSGTVTVDGAEKVLQFSGGCPP